MENSKFEGIKRRWRGDGEEKERREGLVTAMTIKKIDRWETSKQAPASASPYNRRPLASAHTYKKEYTRSSRTAGLCSCVLANAAGHSPLPAIQHTCTHTHTPFFWPCNFFDYSSCSVKRTVEPAKGRSPRPS